MADPFTLISLGLGAAGSLAGGIYNAATADDRKKEWLREQQKVAQLQAIRNSRMTNFWNTNSLDAQHRKNDVEKEAEERFKVDPMTFLPFVQQGTQLAGGIYDAATEPPKGVGSRPGLGNYATEIGRRYSPEELEQFRGRW